jgi:hypothetical protein
MLFFLGSQFLVLNPGLEKSGGSHRDIEERDPKVYTANNFGFMYSRKRISQNSFPNFICVIPKSFMVFYQELRNPKRNYENQMTGKYGFQQVSMILTGSGHKYQ